MMIKNWAAINLVAAFLYLSNAVNAQQQQAEVRDISPPAPGIAVDIPGDIRPISQPQPSINENFFSQLQILQQEVLELRGQVEQQANEIKKLKQQRLDDYLDLDRRMGEINQSSPRPSSPSSLSSPSNPSTRIIGGNEPSSPQPGITSSIGDTPSLAPSEDEKERYRKAIDQVLKQQDYPAAQTGFNDYLSRYPKGYYTPNVYYWQGEIFLLQDKANEATTAFTALINQYPNHGKVPDAKYKLAKVYFQQGKKEEAKILLQAVVQSATDASRLAQSFLDSNY